MTNASRTSHRARVSPLAAARCWMMMPRCSDGRSRRDEGVTSLPCQSRARQRTTEPKGSSDILARILAKGGDPHPYSRVACDLLDRFGSLDVVLCAGNETLLSVPSLTSKDVALLKAFGDLVGMVNPERGSSSPVINSFAALDAYVREHVQAPSVGVGLRMIMTDRTHSVVGDVEVPWGYGPRHTARIMVRKVLEHSAAGVILLWVQASTRAELRVEEFDEIVEQVDAALDRLEVVLLDCALLEPSGMHRPSAWQGG